MERKQFYFEKAKQIFLKGFAPVSDVEWLAGVLEKAEKYDVLMADNEGELLRQLREAPDGSFSKAWGYMMYGWAKALESSSKR